MIKQALRANVIYAIGSLANGLALFILLPYFVNALSQERYGIWALLEITISFISMFMLIGLDMGMLRHYWFLTDGQARRVLIGTALIGVLVWGALLTMFFLGVAWLWQLWRGAYPLGISAADVWLTVSIGWAEALFALYLSVFRAREQAVGFAGFSLLRMTLFIVAAISGVAFGGGITGALFGRLFSVVVTLFIVTFTLRRAFALAFNRPLFLTMARYGFPLLPANIAGYFLFASDRYFLNIFTSPAVVAVYNFAYKISASLDILITRPFATDWAARRFQIAASSNPQVRYAWAIVLYLYAGAGTALLIWIGSPLLYAWIAPLEYHSGLALIPILLAAYLAYGLSYPFNIGLIIKDQTRWLPFINGGATILYILLNLWLVPRYQMMGAAWATLFAYAVMTITLFVFSQYYYPIKVSLQPFVTIGIGVIAVLLWAILVSSFGNTLLLIVGTTVRTVGMIFIWLSTGAALWHFWRKSRVA
ncbi:MAG: polysaccharide biosynthesis C-terminal domain-containing protein [Anaerolineales bacterium]